MDLEILHIADCPSQSAAEAHAHEAVTALGLSGVLVRSRCVATAAEALTTAFAGSPTLTLDGVDLFASSGQAAGLSCRVYPTEHGLAGAPTAAQIVAALRERLRSAG